jgi:hypothetical protein
MLLAIGLSLLEREDISSCNKDDDCGGFSTAMSRELCCTKGQYWSDNCLFYLAHRIGCCFHWNALASDAKREITAGNAVEMHTEEAEW